jgi:diguanylate cyclase (GGDEF)-like protein
VLAAPVPLNEARRLATLRSLSVLDTLPEERFDRIVRLACRIFDVPLAQISLVDERRVWAKSSQGLTLPQMPRETSFCAQTILHDEPLIVTDCLEDARFADSPLVVGDTALRFYAGQALHAADGLRVGTLCIFDRKPRQLSDAEQNSLRDLAAMVDRELSILGHATTDDTTGLANRRGFSLVAEYVLAACRRSGRSATVIVIDLDGHDGDDESLRSFANLLYEHFRASDVVARLGSDEFAVLCSGASTGQVAQSLNRLREVFAKTGFVQQSNDLSWNAGTAEFHPALDADIHELLRVASARKYAAREQARFARDLEDL